MVWTLPEVLGGLDSIQTCLYSSMPGDQRCDACHAPADSTLAMKQIQTAKGSGASYAHLEAGRGWKTRVTPELAAFVAGLDMCYLGTANAEGQPYIQYRGRPPGFLKVLDDQTFGFADFGGNRQYITVGNLSENPKAFLF